MIPERHLQDISMYVHVPFCRRRCNYCDFFSTTYDGDAADKYVEAVSREISFRSGGRRFETIYIGGGTPSCLSTRQLGALLLAIRNSAQLTWDCEFTMEVNPESVDSERLSVAKEFGVNRISMGVQTFDPDLLSLLGRVHTAEEAGRAVRLTRDAGFGNLNLDLIFGIPGETAKQWENDLSLAAAAAPEHISTYCLSIERGTGISQMVLEGSINPLPEDKLREMMETAMERLSREGYAQYEISNYAKAGMRCRHNIKCWRNEEYVGVGPSAVTFIGGTRGQNVRNLRRYVSISDWRTAPHEYEERLDAESRARETLFLGLRMRDGVDLANFESKTGYDALGLCGEEIERFCDLGLMELAEGRVRLTDRGVYVADAIFSEIV